MKKKKRIKQRKLAAFYIFLYRTESDQIGIIFGGMWWLKYFSFFFYIEVMYDSNGM